MNCNVKGCNNKAFEVMDCEDGFGFFTIAFCYTHYLVYRSCDERLTKQMEFENVRVYPWLGTPTWTEANR